MKESWLKGLEKDDQKYMKDAFDAGSLLRKRLGELIEDKYDLIEKNSLSKNNYDSPNWAYTKADEVGYKRALTEILNLLK